jgi:hypothetical protein
MAERLNPFDIMLDANRQVVREEVRNELREALDGNSTKRDWVRAEELASIYDLPRTWFEERGREGVISRTKPGRYVLFYRADLESYLQQHKTGGAK